MHHPIHPKLYEESYYFHGKVGMSLTHSHTRNTFRTDWEAGWQDVDETQWEVTLAYNRHMNGFFSLFGVAVFEGVEGTMGKVRGVFGLRYRRGRPFSVRR